MLLKTQAPSATKCIALLTRRQGLDQFLEVLFRQWGYLIEPPGEAGLLLAEKGCVPPDRQERVIWLSERDDIEDEGLFFPLALEDLWATVESHFHPLPRSHLRLRLLLPVKALRGRGTGTAWLTSLSDAGARLLYPRELVRGEKLKVGFDLSGASFCLEGEVIYVLNCGDPENSQEVEAGIVFSAARQDERRQIREFIVRTYLEQVRSRLQPSRFAEGLASFDLADDVRRELAGPPAGRP